MRTDLDAGRVEEAGARRASTWDRRPVEGEDGERNRMMVRVWVAIWDLPENPDDCFSSSAATEDLHGRTDGLPDGRMMLYGRLAIDWGSVTAPTPRERGTADLLARPVGQSRDTRHAGGQRQCMGGLPGSEEEGATGRW